MSLPSLTLRLVPVPRPVLPPTTVQSLNGFSAKVSWVPPTGDVRGVIDRYELKAYNTDRPGVAPVTATFLANGNLTGKTHRRATVMFVTVDSQAALLMSPWQVPSFRTLSPFGHSGLPQ